MQSTLEAERGKLAGKVAIVTGATSGIGRGIAQLFACEGAKVLLSGRDEARGQSAIDEIAQLGVERQNLAFFGADLCDAKSCQSIVAHAIATFGALDVVVNNAADTSRGDLENTSLELWDRLMAINLRAPFIVMQAALPHLKNRGGSILNIGSVNAYVGETKLLAYSATKGGLMTLTKNAAADLRRYRVRVNVLNAGWTLTEGEDRVMRQDTGRADWLEEAEQTRPFGRLLLPADIARAALFFACDDSALITGSALDLEQNPVGARNT